MTPGKIKLLTVVVFSIVAIFGAVFVGVVEDHRRANEREKLEKRGTAQAYGLARQLDRSLSATFALASIIKQKGTIDDFDSLARDMIGRYGGINSLQLAPEGVVRRIYPLEDNEAAVGHDLLNDPERRIEALAAIESKELTLAGPFKLKQGGTAVIGRYPVFLQEDPGGREVFWGFTIVLVRLPDLLEASNLNQFLSDGYEFELSRTHPDSGERDTFERSSESALDDPVSAEIKVPNGTWTLSIAPRDGWGLSVNLVFEVILVLLLGAVAAFFCRHALRYTFQMTEANKRLEEEITERKKAQKEIGESREFLQTVVDGVSEPVMVIGRDYQVLLANREARRMAGDNDPVSDGAKCYELSHHRPAPCDGDHECPHRMVLETGKPASVTHTHYDVKGNELTVEVSAAPIFDESGEVVRVIEWSHDITEQRRMEEERQILGKKMQEAQKLESLGVMAGGIAHHFNNILQIILGNADLLLDDTPKGTSARTMIEEIEKAARRAAGLSAQMLTYSGQGRFLFEPLNLSNIIKEMSDLIEVTVSEEVVFDRYLSDEVPLVRADAAQVRQVVINLVTNASESLTDGARKITISTGVMDCDRAYLDEDPLNAEIAEGRFGYFEVVDTGCGMDESTREKIFEPFFTTKFMGRGLGLAAVLAIVRAHKGAIRWFSDLNQGTRFRVLFPVSEKNIMG